MIEIRNLSAGKNSYNHKLSCFDAIIANTSSGAVLFMLRPVEHSYQLAAGLTGLREKMDMDEVVIALEMSDMATKIHFLNKDATVKDLFYMAQLVGIDKVEMIDNLSDYYLALEITKLRLRS